MRAASRKNVYILAFTLLLALGFFTLALALIGPALNAHISHFSGEHQGAVMGLNSAASSLGRVVGPLLAGPLFDINVEYPLWNGAATLLLGTLLAMARLRAAKASVTGNSG
jgi:predicted MFS family arabinose efflux permease